MNRIEFKREPWPRRRAWKRWVDVGVRRWSLRCYLAGVGFAIGWLHFGVRIGPLSGGMSSVHTLWPKRFKSVIFTLRAGPYAAELEFEPHWRHYVSPPGQWGWLR